jgi:hypothetical protein
MDCISEVSPRRKNLSWALETNLGRVRLLGEEWGRECLKQEEYLLNSTDLKEFDHPPL